MDLWHHKGVAFVILWSGFYQITHLMNSELYKSLEMPTHDLYRANNVIFNYKYDLMITRLFTAKKTFQENNKKHIGWTSILHLVATKF
jgi:hypothetical protein